MAAGWQVLCAYHRSAAKNPTLSRRLGRRCSINCRSQSTASPRMARTRANRDLRASGNVPSCCSTQARSMRAATSFPPRSSCSVRASRIFSLSASCSMCAINSEGAGVVTEESVAGITTAFAVTMTLSAARPRMRYLQQGRQEPCEQRALGCKTSRSSSLSRTKGTPAARGHKGAHHARRV